MSNGVIVMENGDWAKFKVVLDGAIKPLQGAIDTLKAEVKELKNDTKEAFKELPCIENTTRLVQIETKLANGRQYQKDEQVIKKDFKEFIFKVITVFIGGIGLIATIMGILYGMGFFKALAK